MVKARAWVVDQLVLYAWNNLIPSDENVSLVAVGGFGRGELHPHSDVDLLILLDEVTTRSGTLRKAIEAFVTLLWDAGFYLGHSVRTVEACVSEAKKDIATATSLMESRLLCGREDMMLEMLDATAADQVWSAAEFFDAKFAEQVKRHQQYHDTAYNLEPNIKESPGGLRDIQMIGWVAKRHFNTQSLHTPGGAWFFDRDRTAGFERRQDLPLGNSLCITFARRTRRKIVCYSSSNGKLPSIFTQPILSRIPMQVLSDSCNAITARSCKTKD